MVALHNRLRTLNFDLQGDLSFFKNWTFFMAEDYKPQIGELIPTGPYAGTLGAFQALICALRLSLVIRRVSGLRTLIV
jgi:acid phosphatase